MAQQPVKPQHLNCHRVSKLKDTSPLKRRSGVNPSSSLPFLPSPPNDGRIWCGFSPPFVSCPRRFLRPENGRWKKRRSIRHPPYQTTDRPSSSPPSAPSLSSSFLSAIIFVVDSVLCLFPFAIFSRAICPSLSRRRPLRERALFLSDQSRMTRILELSDDGRSVGCG